MLTPLSPPPSLFDDDFDSQDDVFLMLCIAGVITLIQWLRHRVAVSSSQTNLNPLLFFAPELLPQNFQLTTSFPVITFDMLSVTHHLHRNTYNNTLINHARAVATVIHVLKCCVSLVVKGCGYICKMKLYCGTF